MVRLKHVCACGAAIWDVAGAGRLPKYTELIVCPSCGADHSRRPPLRWRLRYGRYQLRKRRRLFGLGETIRMGVLDAFRLPREREALREVADAEKDVPQTAAPE